MTSHEHLEHLLEMRRTLLRELGRLDRLISSETSRTPEAMSRRLHAGDLTWKDALHGAKITPPHEPFLPG